MNDNLRTFLKDNNISYNKITLKNGVKIVRDAESSYVIKKHDPNLKKVYDYLESRSFDYFPRLIKSNDEYDIYEYIEPKLEPPEQQVSDVMYLLSLLHGKTTFYREVDIDNYKYLYENISTQIEYLYNYYDDIMTIIERNVYMSPSNYLLARNIDKIYRSLAFCKKGIDDWYTLIKDKRKTRVVLIHNNLSLDHYLKSDRPYFISFGKSRIDMPIYDLEQFYRKHYLDFDFTEALSIYEGRYPLLKEEKTLFLVLISLPFKIDMNKREYDLCVEIRRLLDYLYKSSELVSNYNDLKKNIS